MCQQTLFTTVVCSASYFEAHYGFQIPLLDSLSLTKGYFRDIPNFQLADVTDKDEIGKGSFGSVMKGNYIPGEENRGGKAIFRRGRLKSEDRMLIFLMICFNCISYMILIVITK